MEKIQWKNEKRKVADLLPASYNPRKLSDKEREDLTQSIKKFNDVQPVILNTGSRKDIIIGGHQRIKIYADVGIVEIDVRVPTRELTEEEEKELNIRLNKNTGHWDIDKLMEFDKSLLFDIGFDSLEIDKIFHKKTKTKDFDLEEELGKIEVAESKPGEVYEIGRHRVMCGDATDREQVAKLMGGKIANMVFTDPPYNINYQGPMNTHDQKKRDSIENDNMSEESFAQFIYASLKNMLEFTNGAFYVCMSSKELWSVKKEFEKAGGHWQSFIIWVKNTFTLGRSDWQNKYEPILGAKTTIRLGDHHLELDGEVTGKVINKENVTDIWNEKKPSKSKEHPTMKPIKLISRAIKASSIKDDIVLDTLKPSYDYGWNDGLTNHYFAGWRNEPNVWDDIDVFGGSGSTLIAAEALGRTCYMMELDPKYVDVIKKRYNDYIDNKKT